MDGVEVSRSEMTGEGLRRALAALSDEWRGYQKRQVDDLVASAAATIDQLRSAASAAPARVAAATLPRPPAENEALARTLVLAQRAADLVVAEAKNVAARVDEEARSDARRILQEAEAQASERVRTGQAQAALARQDEDTRVAAIVQAAQRRADEIVAIADARAGEREHDAQRRGDAMLHDAETRAASALADAQVRITELVESADRWARQAVSSADGRASQVLAEAESRAAVIWEAARRRVEELDRETDERTSSAVGAAQRRANDLVREAQHRAAIAVSGAEARAAQVVNTAERRASSVEEEAREQAERLVTRTLDEAARTRAEHERSLHATLAELEGERRVLRSEVGRLRDAASAIRDRLDLALTQAAATLDGTDARAEAVFASNPAAPTSPPAEVASSHTDAAGADDEQAEFGWVPPPPTELVPEFAMPTVPAVIDLGTGFEPAPADVPGAPSQGAPDRWPLSVARQTDAEGGRG